MAAPTLLVITHISNWQRTVIDTFWVGSCWKTQVSVTTPPHTPLPQTRTVPALSPRRGASVRTEAPESHLASCLWLGRQSRESGGFTSDAQCRLGTGEKLPDILSTCPVYKDGSGPRTLCLGRRSGKGGAGTEDIRLKHTVPHRGHGGVRRSA